MKLDEAPEKLWLYVAGMDESGETMSGCHFDNDRVHPDDVQYVRADLDLLEQKPTLSDRDITNLYDLSIMAGASGTLEEQHDRYIKFVRKYFTPIDLPRMPTKDSSDV